MAKANLMPTVAAVGNDEWLKVAKGPQVRAEQKVIQTITFKIGSFDDDNRTFRAIASTDVVDRSGDVIEQDGWDVTNFVKNPVIPWCHDYWQPPVARAIEIGVADGALQFTYQAPPKGLYEFADTVWDLYRNGFMFAFSVGFIPKKKDGSAVGWEDYDWDGNTWEAAELLEISAVVVPANPEALALGHKAGIISEKAGKSLMDKTNLAMKHLEESLKNEQKDIEEKESTSLNALEEAVERAVQKAVSAVTDQLIAKGAISSDLPIAPKDTAWDSGAAIKAIKKWASNDDGDIDFSKYRKCFMWVDGSGGDKQGDYKLPFADIIDGSPKAVWNGVKAIMSVINGGRGGVDIPEDDRKAVYTQVKKYYKKFDEEAPDLKALNSDSLTPEDGTENNKDMSKSTETAVEKKDLGLGSDGGGDLAPVQHVGEKEEGYASISEALRAVSDTLNSHSQALRDHASTMTTHAGIVQSKADYLAKAADLLDHQGDETTETPDGGTAEKEDAENVPNDKDGDGLDDRTRVGDDDHAGQELEENVANNPKLERSAKKVETKEVEDEPEAEKPEVEEEPKEEEAPAEEDAETSAEPEADDVETEEAEESEVEESAEVKSEEEAPEDGAEHEDEADPEEEEVDPENLTDEQVQKLLELVNAELKSQTGE